MELHPDRILLYGRPGCPSVTPVRRLLDEAGVAYNYLDIRQDAEAAARLRQLTGGYESVPTLVFPDGSVLVEPWVGALRKRLQELGQGGAALDSSTAVFKAGLSNPVYLILALIALALTLAVWLSA
ncbi:glutaredoxin family protein [Promineifilum sp.]|uniref:glutaredoxin family protein n=1 Tax=Promineifilum sp. TaxID=2664178 RepID=UPI0035B420C0